MIVRSSPALTSACPWSVASTAIVMMASVCLGDGEWSGLPVRPPAAQRPIRAGTDEHRPLIGANYFPRKNS